MPTSIETLVVALYLLPGFLGYVAFELVASDRKRDSFDKIAGAMCLTLAGHLVSTYFVGEGIFALLEKTTASKFPDFIRAFLSKNILISTVAALVIGLVWGVCENKGWIYLVLGKLRITKRTGALDVWCQLFERSTGVWVRIVYKDGRILVGWPKYFSEISEKDKRQLFLAEACWHFPKGDISGKNRSEIEYVEAVVTGPGVLILSFDDVRDIELI